MDVALHLTFDLDLVAFSGSVEPFTAHLRAELSLSQVEARDLVDEVVRGNRVRLYEDLTEREADLQVAGFARFGARLEKRAWRHPDPCDVILVRVGEKKLRVVQLVCDSDAGISLETAIALVDAAPVSVRTNVHRKKAEDLQALLHDAGAEAQVVGR